MLYKTNKLTSLYSFERASQISGTITSLLLQSIYIKYNTQRKNVFFLVDYKLIDRIHRNTVFQIGGLTIATPRLINPLPCGSRQWICKRDKYSSSAATSLCTPCDTHAHNPPSRFLHHSHNPSVHKLVISTASNCSVLRL